MKFLRQFLRDTRGTTIIEFAVVAPIFFLIIFAIIELGLLMFSQVALESATMQVSRSAAICNKESGGGADCAQAVRTLIAARTRGLINAENIRIQANPLANGGIPSNPELCLTNPPSTPAICPSGTMFDDRNGNGRYDGPGEVTVGTAGQLVEIRVSYPWRTLIPMMDRIYGDDGVMLLSASTIIKNEPQ